MGLDACVFRNIKHLEAEFGPGLFEITDEDAGEAEPREGVPDWHRLYDARIAVDHRIGNIAMVAYLRGEVATHIGARSVLIEKVLYDGTHCGDSVGPEFFPQMRAELAVLVRVGCPETLHFAGQMAQLIGASELEGNPIEF